MRRYASLTSAFQLKAVGYALDQGNHTAGIRHFRVDEIRIRYWKNQREKLMATTSTRRAFRGTKTGKFPDDEEAVLEYVRDMRIDGFALSLDMIRTQARTILEGWEFPAGRRAPRGGMDCR
ncbi:hypothetical protein MTO96_035178 [Rhipicephalus appendiculatus]